VKRVIVILSSFALVNCASLRAASSGNLAGAAQAAAEEAKAAAAKIEKAKKDAEKDCHPLNLRVGKDCDTADYACADDAAKAKALEDAKAKGFGVSWNEERAIGSAIAIGFAKSGKGPYVDITDKNLVELQKKAEKDRTKVKLTASEKNDLNMYIQVVGDHVAAGSTRPGIAWTFGVIDNDDTVNAFSTPGGYVLITTGLLKLMDNEAQLAAVLGHEIGHVMHRHAVHQYADAKAFSCNVAVTGYYLVEAGASNIPGAEEFVKNAKFGKTMKAFASSDVDMDKNPDVDADFIRWFTNRVIDAMNLTGRAKEDELDADRSAFELMAAAGYDTKELDNIINKLPSSWALFAHHPSNSDRVEAIGKIRTEGSFGADGGKAPKFPANVKWPPKPAS
jgi:Zn-dependent protease with chaperone function